MKKFLTILAMVSDSSNRQTNVDAALAQLEANGAAIMAHSQQHNVPLDQQPAPADSGASQ